MCTLGCVPGRQICFFVVFCRSVSGRYPSSHCAQTDRSKHFAYVSCVLFLAVFFVMFHVCFFCPMFSVSCVVCRRLSSVVCPSCGVWSVVCMCTCVLDLGSWSGGRGTARGCWWNWSTPTPRFIFRRVEKQKAKQNKQNIIHSARQTCTCCGQRCTPFFAFLGWLVI